MRRVVPAIRGDGVVRPAVDTHFRTRRQRRVALEPIFKAITDSLSEVAKDVEAIKRQPRAGGPTQRVVADKQLTSQPAAAQAEPQVSKVQIEKAIGQYKQLANVEADPTRKAYYAGKVAELEKAL